jgi:ABC-type sugar transport system substrate-binding protein
MRKHPSLVWSTIRAVFLLCTISVTVQAQPRKLAIFSPGNDQNTFWSQVIAYTKAACDDFGWQLEVYYANDDHLRMVSEIERAAKSASRADVFLFPAMKDAGEACLKVCEANKVPAFTINMGLDEKIAGAPRTKYKYWIGQMVPDDEVAGYELGALLIKQARAAKLTTASGQIGVVAVSGRTNDAAAILRNRGLEKAVSGTPGTVMQPVLFANWERQSAVDQVRTALQKNADYGVIWAASDDMALGIVQASGLWALPAGQKLMVGGVDWTPEAIQAVADKKMVATAGGHFMEGGWAAVMLYDYFNGKDFAVDGVNIKSPMSLITAENAKLFQTKLGDGNWGRINFNLFTKTNNKSLKTYNFKIETVLLVLR